MIDLVDQTEQPKKAQERAGLGGGGPVLLDSPTSSERAIEREETRRRLCSASAPHASARLAEPRRAAGSDFWVRAR